MILLLLMFLCFCWAMGVYNYGEQHGWTRRRCLVVTIAGAFLIGALL